MGIAALRLLLTLSGQSYLARNSASADLFQKVHFSDHIITIDQDSPHIIGKDGKEMWATGGWSTSIKGENFGPTQIKGYWSVIREGDDWKIRMLTSNLTPTPAPAETK